MYEFYMLCHIWIETKQQGSKVSKLFESRKVQKQKL